MATILRAPRILFISFLIATLCLSCSSTEEQATSTPTRSEHEKTNLTEAKINIEPSSEDSIPGAQIENTGASTAVAGTTYIPSLNISEIDADLPSYNRDDWKHWTDIDRDCQNARHEVLIEESIETVSFTDDRGCSVATGLWIAPFTGSEISSARGLDVDHMVPLANAHKSGGWAWDYEMKKEFANDLSYAGHLIAVSSSANRSKGAKGPEDWKPPDEGYWCDYALDWINIKSRWELSATPSEWKALLEMLGTCDSNIQKPNDRANHKSDIQPTPKAMESGKTLPASSSPCVDINNAEIGDLGRILHIANERAEDILNLRPFASVNDMDNIPGIGPSRLNDIIEQGLACVP